LGLSQVLGFAKQSGGGVKLESRLGHGTIVRIFLPRTATAEATAQATPTADSASAEGTRVLLVDDDAPVRDVIAARLRELGYEVAEAGSGGAALDILDADAAIDVALLDFAMPGMNGVELARQIGARRPSLPILFVTGYAETGALADIGEDRIILKPPMDEDLSRKLSAATCAARTRSSI
jgi:CheY-like chemotaxis protein